MKPLSRQAQELANAAVDDPSQQELASLFQALQVVQTVPVSSQPTSPTVPEREVADDQVHQMRAARQAAKTEHVPLQKTSREALFSATQKQGIDRLAVQVVSEKARQKLEEERRIEEERQRQAEAERQRREQEEERRRLVEKINLALSASRGKTFSSNQEARRFYMGLVAGLPDELLRSLTSGGLRWRCNAFGVVHYAPTDCAAPGVQGGVWLLD